MEDFVSPSSQQPRKELDEVKKDRLTSLPNSIIDVILVGLPLKDAVRTSILSQAWRYQWTNLSRLNFCREHFPRAKNESEIDYDKKLVSIIDQALLLHQGRVQKIDLDIELVRCIDINRWVLFVSRNGIREITLLKWKGERYKVPSCLFSCKELTSLDLFNCTMVVPISFKGFSTLTTLYLDHVSLSNICLEKLISGSPLLCGLGLSVISGTSTHLSIRAPNLNWLIIEQCSFKDVWFVDTPILVEAQIELLADDKSQPLASGAKCKLVETLGRLPSTLKRLDLLDNTFQILSKGDAPVAIPTTCQLLHFSASLNFDDRQHMLIALCIFRSSLLQKIDLEAILETNINQIFSIDEFWGAQGDLMCLFSHLRTLTVREFKGTTAELKFVEVVLANAPVLDEVQIILKKDVANQAIILKTLNRLRRLSQAEVVIPD